MNGEVEQPGLLRNILTGLLSNPTLISRLVILEHGISLALSRIIDIRIIQQSLDAQHNLEKSIRISPLGGH
jgi:hypothetical protein